MKTFEELKAEAIARGIKPGAKILCAYGHGEGIVAPYEEWHEFADGIRCGTDTAGNSLRAFTYGRWATVITPAPDDQSDGLVDGMACEPDEHMRRAIVKKAKELGIVWAEEAYGQCKRIGYASHCEVLQVADGVLRYTVITPGEFYDRLCKTAKPELPIRIGCYNVEFNKGSIKVGCTEIPNDIVRKVAERLKD